MRIAGLALLLGGMMVASACGASASSAGGETSRRSDRNTITAEDLTNTSATNMYDVIQRTHPLWLRPRGRTSVNLEGDIVVYLDDNRFGGPETLRQISPTTVQSARFLDASAAQQRFGVGHTHGAILVYTKR